MDRLSGDDLKRTCSVLEQRYRACVKESLVKDVLANADINALNPRCTSLYAQIKLYCLEALPGMKTGTDQGAEGARVDEERRS